MVNDVTAWRASIGLFNNRFICYERVMRHIKSNIFNLFSHLVRLFIVHIKCSLLNGLQSAKIKLQLILFNTIAWLLILQAGDVEMDPGPIIPEKTYLLSLLHCNIRGIRNKLNFIREEFLDFNVLCFTETHLNEKIYFYQIHLTSLIEKIELTTVRKVRSISDRCFLQP